MAKPKRVFIIIHCLIYMVICFQFNTSASRDIIVKINGSNLNFSNKPKTINGRLLVPAVDLVEKMGATIEWKSVTSSVVIYSNTQDNKVILFKIGQKAAVVNGVEVILDAAPIIYNKKTYVPLSFVSECLGAKVKWDSKIKTVSITYKVPNQEETPILIPPWELPTTSG